MHKSLWLEIVIFVIFEDPLFFMMIIKFHEVLVLQMSTTLVSYFSLASISTQVGISVVIEFLRFDQAQKCSVPKWILGTDYSRVELQQWLVVAPKKPQAFRFLT